MRVLGLTNIALGKQVGLDAPTIQRLFTGHRRIYLEEVPRLAESLQATQVEVFAAFGLDLSADAATGQPGASKLVLSGVVDGNLTARLGETFVRGPKSVSCPFAEKDLRGLRMETAASPYAWLDGRVVFYRDTQIRGTKLTATAGALMLVQLKTREDWLVRVVRRGYAGVGSYTLEDFAGKALETDVRLNAAREILWIRYS